LNLHCFLRLVANLQLLEGRNLQHYDLQTWRGQECKKQELADYNALMHFTWVSTFYREFISHFHLLLIRKGRIRDYLASPYKIILIVLFTLLFLPHAFIVVNDLGMISAFEVDPGSIVQSILSLYTHSYNMNIGYHSSQYGWTYFAINYFVLLPIYLLTKLLFFRDNYYLFVGIRLLFFFIGLASVLAFFEVALRTLKHNLLSFIAAILFIVSSLVFRFFYFLHPETTGLFFAFIGLLCLINFNDRKADDYRWYTWGLVSLTLAILAKQSFLFVVIPVILLYLLIYCYHHKMAILDFMISKQFLKILMLSTSLIVVVFFAINPYAFLQPDLFLKNQLLLFSIVTKGPVTLAPKEAISKWMDIIRAVPVIYTSILLAPFSILGAVILERKNKPGKLLYIVNIISVVFYVTVISVTSRFIINKSYFVPIFPFFVLNFLSIPLYLVRRWNNNPSARYANFILVAAFALTLIIIVMSDLSSSLPLGYTRFKYQNSLAFKTYEYIEKNIPDGSKIAHDHLVAIPTDKKISACHYWQGCGTDYIEGFQPDYVFFVKNWTFNEMTTPPTKRLEKYITNHQFILINTITGFSADEAGHIYSVSIWKKPEK
jgi:hypothetical protein